MTNISTTQAAGGALGKDGLWQGAVAGLDLEVNQNQASRYKTLAVAE